VCRALVSSLLALAARCRRVARRAWSGGGGNVDVVSAGLGQDSVFTVCLPIVSPYSKINRMTEPTEESVGSTASQRILLVEDEDDVAESMGALLAMDGHIVSSASNGNAAIEMLHTFEPKVVLLELRLPGIDGYQVARRMRIETPIEALVIIVMSDYGEAKHLHRSRDSGCDGHLVKPVQPELLLKVLSSSWKYDWGKLILPSR